VGLQQDVLEADNNGQGKGGGHKLPAGDIHMQEREMTDPAEREEGCSPSLSHNRHDEKLVNLTGPHGETRQEK
jgi:hypothetical protein